MIACLDVYYSGDTANAAAIVFSDWQSDSPVSKYTALVRGIAEYEAGRFYLRELEPLRAVISKIAEPIHTYLIDAYCHLSDDHAPGLGSYLFESLDQKATIVGVAKNRYRDSKHAVELLRGRSIRPLFVTSIGIPYDTAARHVASMIGQDRIPVLIRAADRLSREPRLSESRE